MKHLLYFDLTAEIARYKSDKAKKRLAREELPNIEQAIKMVAQYDGNYSLDVNLPLSKETQDILVSRGFKINPIGSTQLRIGW